MTRLQTFKVPLFFTEVCLLTGAVLYATNVDYDAHRYRVDRDDVTQLNVTTTTAPSGDKNVETGDSFKEDLRRNVDNPEAMKSLLYNLLNSMMAEMAATTSQPETPEPTTESEAPPTESVVVLNETTEAAPGQRKGHGKGDYYYKAEVQYCYQVSILAAVLALVASALGGYLGCRDAYEVRDLQRL